MSFFRPTPDRLACPSSLFALLVLSASGLALGAPASNMTGEEIFNLKKGPVTDIVVIGVTPAQLEVASARVPMLTFVTEVGKTRVTWSMACKGPEKSLSCTVTSAGQPAGRLVSASSDKVVLNLGGGDWELRPPRETGVSLANVRIEAP